MLYDYMITSNIYLESLFQGQITRQETMEGSLHFQCTLKLKLHYQSFSKIIGLLQFVNNLLLSKAYPQKPFLLLNIQKTKYQKIYFFIFH